MSNERKRKLGEHQRPWIPESHPAALTNARRWWLRGDLQKLETKRKGRSFSWGATDGLARDGVKSRLGGAERLTHRINPKKKFYSNAA